MKIMKNFEFFRIKKMATVTFYFVRKSFIFYFKRKEIIFFYLSKLIQNKHVNITMNYRKKEKDLNEVNESN